jgi:hypothetical protein
MKKFGIAALLAAGVVAASGVFAQEIKFDGYVNTGLGIISTDAKVLDGEGPDTKTADIKVVPFGVDSGQSGYRFRLNGSYTSEDGNSGAKFRLQAQSKFTAGALSIPYAYGWGSFLNKVLTVTGGLVDDSTWANAGAIWGVDAGEGLGALIKVSPIDGLNLGVGAYAITPQSGGNNNVLIVPGEKPNSDGIIVGDFSQADIPLDRLKYTFNAGYTVPDLLKVNISFRTANQAGNADSRYAKADSEKFDGNEETSALIFGAQVLAVKDLTAVLEVVADKLEDTGESKDLDDINVDLYETLGYKLGDLSFGLNAAQYIRIGKEKEKEGTEYKDVDHDLGVQLNPWVSYAIGSIVPRLDFTYFLAGKALTGPTKDPTKPAALTPKYHRTVFGYFDTGEDFDDVSVIAIRPSVKFNVGKSFIEIGDLIALASGPDGSFPDAKDLKRSSSFDNVFYVDFKWSF